MFIIVFQYLLFCSSHGCVLAVLSQSPFCIHSQKNPLSICCLLEMKPRYLLYIPACSRSRVPGAGWSLVSALTPGNPLRLADPTEMKGIGRYLGTPPTPQVFPQNLNNTLHTLVWRKYFKEVCSVSQYHVLRYALSVRGTRAPKYWAIFQIADGEEMDSGQ